jgi:hypothetical protein
LNLDIPWKIAGGFVTLLFTLMLAVVAMSTQWIASRQTGNMFRLD